MFGFLPLYEYHLIFLLVPFGSWLLTRSIAKRARTTIVHTSSLVVSYWEEALFRGIVLGGILMITGSALAAVILNSAVFGVFHLRNLWWLSRRQVLINCLYTGLLFGPVVGLLRLWSGDIYLGIALHAIHNFVFISLPTKVAKPTDYSLLAKQKTMNKFEYFFSGFWLMRNRPS